MTNFLYDKEKSINVEKFLFKKGFSELSLIMKSARGILEVLNQIYDESKIWIFCGSGKNASDGIFLSILAYLEGKEVSIIKLGSFESQNEVLITLLKKLNIKITNKIPEKNEIISNDIVIDAIFGLGINRKPTKIFKEAIQFINLKKKDGPKVISVDIPSGLDPSTGLSLGDTIKADFTVMCLTRKQGCYTGEAAEFVGNLKFVDLGLEKKISKIEGSSEILTIDSNTFNYRSKIAHKGNYGNVLVLGGWDDMEGAAFLAALASLKSGAGKVFICGPERENIPYEIIRLEKSISEIKKILPEIDCIVAGPGLGKNGYIFLEEIWNTKVPLVLDADALRWLSHKKVRKRNSFFCGTPHMGEAFSLIGKRKKDRFEIISDLKKYYGGVWVLKGAGTIILNDNLYVNPFSNSILSTAGSGDVLAGIIGGLIAQNVDNPVNVGVILHSNAARMCLFHGNKTILSSDLIKNINLNYDLNYDLNDELIRIK